MDGKTSIAGQTEGCMQEIYTTGDERWQTAISKQFVGRDFNNYKLKEAAAAVKGQRRTSNGNRIPDIVFPSPCTDTGSE